MTVSLIIMYVMAAVVMAICIVMNMRRSILRGCVSLGMAMLAIPLTILLTHHTLDRVTTKLLHTIDLGSIAPLAEAIPSLEESAVALVHMVVATEVCRLVFFVLLAVFGVASHFVCRALECKLPVLAKKSKPVGAAVGVALGLVMLVAVFTPTAGYAAEAPEVIHILGEVEQITHKGEEAMSDEATTLQQGAQRVSDTALLKMVRALGGKAIFRATTAVEIGGVETDLYSEFHALDAIGNKVAVLTTVSVDQFSDVQYDAIKALADDIEASVLLRTLSAEALCSLSRAWRSGEPFIGIEKPSDGGVIDVAIDVVLKRFENTTQQTVAEDIRKLAPAVATAIKVFNVYQSMNSGLPVIPSKPSQSPSGNEQAPTTPTEPSVPGDQPSGDAPSGGEGSTPGETPSGGNTDPSTGEVPSAGETPSAGNTPSAGDTPPAGNTPAEGEKPADENKPGEGNTPSGGASSDNTTTPSTPPPPAVSITQTLDAVIDMFGEELQEEETKNLVIEIGLSAIAQQLQQFVVTPQKPKEEPKPADPAPEAPKPEDPKPADPEPEDPKTEDPEPADPKPEEPKPEDPKPEDSKTEDPKPEDQKPEDPKTEDPKPEDPKAEDPKPADPAPEAPKVEDPKPEAPKPEEPKQQEPAPITPESSGLAALLPGVSEEVLPPDTEISQEEYDGFVDGMIDLAVSGTLSKPTEEIVEDVIAVRDQVGIDLTDELCQMLVDAVMNSPYASLFK